MSASQSSPRPDGVPDDLVRTAQPIMGPEAARIEEEARERAAESGHEIMGERRRGRVEAEAHRASEEMTRRAQEQRRAALHNEPPQAPPARNEAGPVPAQRRLFPTPTPIRRVLVPLSGEAFAERATPFAVAIARLAGASLAFVHVGDQIADDHAAAPMAHEPGTDEILHEQLAADATGIEKVERIDLPEGPVAERLLALEAPDGSDVVVVALRRQAGAEGETLGAVMRDLVRHGRAPVLAIPPSATAPGFRRILVPLDGSILAEQALAPVISLTREGPGAAPGTGDGLHEIVLFSVVEARQTMDDAYAYLNDICEVLQSSVPAAVQFTVEARLGSAPGAIVATAAQGGEAMREQPAPFDLIALATHGRGGLRRWLLGSVAEYVLTHATVPVLVVRPAVPAQIED